MCMGVLSAHMPVHHVWAVPVEARRKCQIPLGLELQMVLAAMWVSGTEPSPLKEQSVLVTSEPPLQPLTKGSEMSIFNDCAWRSMSFISSTQKGDSGGSLGV